MIGIASWCGPEFETTVSDLVADYLLDDNVPDLPTGFRKNQCIEIYELEEGEPLLGNWPLPIHFKSPMTLYIIQVGTKDKTIGLFKWGISEDPRYRLGAHQKKYKNILTRVLISLGQCSGKGVEDNVKAMMESRRVILSMKTHPNGYESFKVKSSDGDGILNRIRLHVEAMFADIVQYSWFDGHTYYDRAEVEGRENKLLEAEQEITRRELAIEQERTHRELEILRATNEQLRLQLELAKLAN